MPLRIALAIIAVAILGIGIWPAPASAVEAGSGEATTAPDSSTPPSFPLAIPPARAEQLVAEIDLKLGQIDRSQFDTEVLLEKHSYDEAEIIRFVQENIAFEDYNGVLRGVKGTLRSRAGNSIDQALLLASLLKDIGADARIVEGVMSPDELTELVVQKRADAPGVFGQTISTAQQNKASQENSVFPVPAQVTSITAQIVEAMQEQDGDFAAHQLANNNEPTAYFWVEYRDSASSPWSAVHPVLTTGDASPPEVKPIRYFADSIGEELQQRVSVQAFIDRSWNGKTETLAVTKLYEYPAANLSGRTFSYSVIPNVDLGEAAGDDVRAQELLSKATLFFPVFDFGSPTSDMAFDTTGNTLAAEDASSDKAAIFQTVGGKFGDVADALDTGGKDNSTDSKPQRHVTRHWLKFTIQQPGQEPKVIIRDIAQWHDSEDQFKQSLSRIAYFRVETGAVAPAEFLDQNLRAMKQSIRTAMLPLTRKSLSDAALQFSLDAELFLFASDIIARRQSGQISYRDAPAIVARYAPFGRIDLDREGFDIISSPRRVLSAGTGQLLPAASIASGVIDTWLEYKLFAGEEWLKDSAFEKLDGRMKSGESLTLLSAASSKSINQIPQPGRAFIQRDIDNQSLVLFPGDAKQCDSWWRVDPLSGETIGMLDNGWGAASSEYVQDLILIYGKVRVQTALVACGTVIAFIKGSAFLAGWNAFNIDEGLGWGGLDLCSQLPHADLQALCTVVVAAAAVAGEAGLEGVSAEALKIMCLKAVFG